MNCVTVNRVGAITTITLNRPQVLNAIDQAMWEELLSVFHQLRQDEDTSVCIVTGAGRSFCSGADLKETAWHGESVEQSRQRIDSHHQELARTILAIPVPVIAAINGYALGGGAEIALACDIRIAADDALIGFPEAAVGRSITGGASLLLTRTVGLSRAKRLLFTSENIDAVAAQTIGLVDEVVAASTLLEAATKLAERINATSTHSVRLLKRLVDDVALDGLESALQRETEALTGTYSAPDIDAAREAFAKR